MTRMDIQVFGIHFEHRQPDEPVCVREYAEFMAFAARLALAGATRHVHRVFFDTKWMGFNIDADPAIEGTQVHWLIRQCAEQSFSQFNLLGEYGRRAAPSESQKEISHE